MELLDAIREDPERAIALIQRGADVNRTYIFLDNGTPLHYACRHQPSLVEYLILKGADIHAHTTEGRRTPLHIACMYHISAVEVLVRHGADLDDENEYGYTPLEVACRMKQSATVRFLYEQNRPICKYTFRHTELTKVVAIYGGMCWKRSEMGGLSSRLVTGYLSEWKPC
jgi:ankyrin repeat protein